MLFLRVLSLSTVAFGTPNRQPVKRQLPVYAPFEVKDFAAGGLPGTVRNYIRFAIRVKPSASFASCSVTTSTGPIVPTIERLVCNEDKSIVWSLQPVGNSMFLSIWWDYSSQESLYGGEHFDPVSIKKVTLDDGSVVESYVGPTNYTLPTAPTTWEPLALNGLE